MIQLIALIIFIVSILGIVLILFRKIPVLVQLPQNGGTGIKNHQFILDVEEKLKKFLIDFEKQIFLHKFLSWVKVMTLRIEVQVDHLLHGIRKKAQKIDKDLKEKK